MNVVTIYVANPEQLLATAGFGAGALIRVESSATGGGAGYAEIGTVAIVTGTNVYAYEDQAATTGTWYRTRYSNAGNTNRSDYSPEFQATTQGSTGQYARLAGVKIRMQQAGQVFGANDDAILTILCQQVNGWLEATTGRIFQPYPAVNTTLNGAVSIGATQVTLTAPGTLAAGDALMLGPVSGTHEHGIVAAVSGSVVTLQAGLVNAYGNGASAQRCYLWDGFDTLEGGYILPVPNGLVSMTSLELAFYTGGAFNLIPATDWFLRPLPLDREPGWPATEIWMTDIPSSNNPQPLFMRGRANVRALCTPGWPSTPYELVALAEKLVVGAYRARGSGGGSSVTIGTDGTRLIEQSMSAQDWRTLNHYTSKDAVIV